MKDKNIKLLLRNLLLIIIVLIYILFLYLDIFNIKILIPSNILKYITIILCSIVSLLIGKDKLSKRDKILLQMALFITVLADLCFLILNYYILGIILFCLVQIIYYNRYKGGAVYSPPLNFVKFIIIFLLIIISHFIINLTLLKLDFLYTIAFFYSICIIISIVESIKAFKNNLYPCYNKYIIVIGMVLFLLCDINIAIFNISEKLNPFIYNVSSILIWSFYLPSQVLLCISGYRFN